MILACPPRQSLVEGFFHAQLDPIMGEVGGDPDVAYEELPSCPCAGVGGMCLTLLMDDRKSITPCFCNCQD